MRTTHNPLIGATSRETIQNASEALDALMVLLASEHSGLCRLLSPIAAALEHEANPDP